MAVKYVCPKCGRKFTEWGAEKLGFKCPRDKFCPEDATEDIELVRAGTQEDHSHKRVALKRTPKRKAVPVIRESMLDDDEAMVPDVDAFSEEGEYGAEEEDAEEDEVEEVHVDEVDEVDVEEAEIEVGVVPDVVEDVAEDLVIVDEEPDVDADVAPLDAPDDEW